MDSADPQIINYLTERNMLPNFRRLKEQGAYGELQSFAVKSKQYPQGVVVSLPVIATIFTGRPPEEHGMVSHIFLPEGPDNYYPFSSMPVPSVWNIANAHNLSAGIIGTLGNYPVEQIKGYIVSGEYIKKTLAKKHLSFWQSMSLDRKFKDSELVYPSFIKDEVNRNIPKQRELAEEFRDYNLSYDFPEDIEKFYIEAYEKMAAQDSRRIALGFAAYIAKSNMTMYYAFVDDLTTMYNALFFYSNYQTPVFVEYLENLDFVTNMHHTYEQTNYASAKGELLDYYKFYDKHLGEVIDLIDGQTTLIVLSDHGAIEQQYSGNYTFVRRDKGVIFFYGNQVRKGKLDNMSVYDVAPTMLYLLNLPPERMMKGKLPTGSFIASGEASPAKP